MFKAVFRDTSALFSARFLGSVTLPGQTKTVIPSDAEQTVTPDVGKTLSAVTVQAIPRNYGKIIWNGSTLTVS